jgi:hypothetical protein
MTIGLTYNGDLSRVQIALSSLTVAAVRIERSTNELYWETVRGGTEVTVSAGAASLDDYEFAADAENFYRVLDVADDSVEESDSITPPFADCEAWLKSIRYPLLNHEVNLANYTDLERPGRSGVFDVTGRSFPVATSDVGASLRFELGLNTETAAQARKLSLAMAVGDVMFLHIGPNSNPKFPPRSIYFVSTSTRIQRVGVETRRRHWSPLVEVAPPAADVVGTTLTWGTVWNQYASWTQLWAANPTWSDLLATVGDPDDLVVL